MRLITRTELKSKIDGGDDFKLVNVLDELAFKAKHIPGSINICKLEDCGDHLDHKDDIVVYCSGPSCFASMNAFRFLDEGGYTNVRRYAGGLQDWEAAGYPLIGEEIV